MKHYKLVEILSNYNVKQPPLQTPLIDDFLATVLRLATLTWHNSWLTVTQLNVLNTTLACF